MCFLYKLDPAAKPVLSPWSTVRLSSSWHQFTLTVTGKIFYIMAVQAALAIRGGYVPEIFREYQNRE